MSVSVFMALSTALYFVLYESILQPWSPRGSSYLGRYVTVRVYDVNQPVGRWSGLTPGGHIMWYRHVNQPSLPTPFYSVLVSISVFMALPTVFQSINSPEQLSVSSLSSSGLISLP